jgi:hypothetical protein
MREGIGPSDAWDLDRVRVPLVLGARGDECHVDIRCNTFGAGGVIPVHLLVRVALGLDAWARSSTTQASGGLFLVT